MRRIEELKERFQDVEGVHTTMAMNDLFSVGCHMHASGERGVGLKLVLTALRACEAPTSLIDWVVRMLRRGCETELAAVASVHAEVLKLWRADGRLPWHQSTGIE